MNTNEIVSYDLSTTPNLEQIVRMLDRALDKFPNVEDLIQSMLRKGNCYDNCIMESFFGRLKNEMYYGHEKDYSSFEEFSKAVAEYIDYYNNKRIQAKTKWMPPVKYRITSMCST